MAALAEGRSEQYNARNPAVKRLMKEAAELSHPTELYYAQPLDDNLFEWHFTVRGPPDTDFAGGVYHGRIILPPEYPMKPPSVVILTPNGRFELNKKICLSISGFHPESWQPSWSIRTALLAIIGFMPTHGEGAIGSLDYTAAERQNLARQSLEWTCPTCRTAMQNVLPALTEKSQEQAIEARDLAKQINFKDEKEQEASARAATQAASSAEQQHQLRQRRDVTTPDRLTSSAASTPPAAATPLTQHRPQPAFLQADRGEAGSGSWGAIVLVFIAIAALALRRLYLLNEWRFHAQ